jgi:hypothetical protein
MNVSSRLGREPSPSRRPSRSSVSVAQTASRRRQECPSLDAGEQGGCGYHTRSCIARPYAADTLLRRHCISSSPHTCGMIVARLARTRDKHHFCHATVRDTGTPHGTVEERAVGANPLSAPCLAPVRPEARYALATFLYITAQVMCALQRAATVTASPPLAYAGAAPSNDLQPIERAAELGGAIGYARHARPRHSKTLGRDMWHAGRRARAARAQRRACPNWCPDSCILDSRISCWIAGTSRHGQKPSSETAR